MRQYQDCVIFIMGIPIPERRSLHRNRALIFRYWSEDDQWGKALYGIPSSCSPETGQVSSLTVHMEVVALEKHYWFNPLRSSFMWKPAWASLQFHQHTASIILPGWGWGCGDLASPVSAWCAILMRVLTASVILPGWGWGCGDRASPVPAWSAILMRVLTASVILPGWGWGCGDLASPVSAWGAILMRVLVIVYFLNIS